MADSTPTLRRRRLIVGTNVLVQILAVLALVGLANWYASRHHTRFDWTKSGYYKLSDQTKQVLAALPEPLKVIVYLQPQAENELEEKIFSDVRNLLGEFQFHGKDKLKIEYVDPVRDLARARQVIEEYKFDVREPALVIFAYGGRSKYVARDEMADIDYGGGGMMGMQTPPRIRSFKAEGAFLSAIKTVTQGEPPTVFFLTGHGERDPEDYDPRTGLATLATYIKRDNINFEKWNVLEKQSLPTNAAALVIAGPRKPFSAAEQSALDTFLQNHGRLYVMLDAHTTTGLETLLAKWGVQVDNNLAISKAGSLFGTMLLNVNAVAAQYARHPVTARLTDINTEFPNARSIRAAKTTVPAADRPTVTELVTAAPAFWGETNLDDENAAFDPKTDTAGPLPLAVAIETGKLRDAAVDLGETRAIVVGTSAFVGNNSLTAGNLDFFMSGLNWLLKRDQLLAVSPKTPEEFQLDMTARQLTMLYWIVVYGFPFSIGVLGLCVWYRRRK